MLKVDAMAISMDGAAPRSDAWVPGRSGGQVPAGVVPGRLVTRVALRRWRALQGDGVLGLKWLR